MAITLVHHSLHELFAAASDVHITYLDECVFLAQASAFEVQRYRFYRSSAEHAIGAHRCPND